ncbi:MAG TPA: hypothetical protein PLQ54_12195 [Armatimonadota bacterium]|nr:hypothetical protein [Armatimonadota bacterium]
MSKESTTLAPDTSAQAWLDEPPAHAPIPCTPWCQWQDPSQEGCFGPSRITPLSLEERLVDDDGCSVRYVTVYAALNRTTGAPPAVHVGLGEDRGWLMTTDEARTLAAALVAAAGEVRSL